MRRFALLSYFLFVQAANASDAWYGYDALGRLVATENNNSATETVTSIYWLDNADNRSRVVTQMSTASELIVYRFSQNLKHFYTVRFSEGFDAGFTKEGTGFKLYRSAATDRYPLYRCRSGNDYFISVSSTCEGVTFEHQIGFASNIQTTANQPLYRFSLNNDHLITLSYAEGVNAGYAYESMLGYVPK